MATTDARSPLGPRPVLVDGPDLLLRALGTGDVDDLVAMRQDPDWVRWTNAPVPYGRADALALVLRGDEEWSSGRTAAFAVAHTGRLAGTVTLRVVEAGWAEVGFGLAPWARGRGLMSRALRLVLRWGFGQVGLEGVHWQAHVGNWASRRVAWACGFRIEGTVRGLCVQRGQRRDAWMGSVRRGDPLHPATAWLPVPELPVPDPAVPGARLRPWRPQDAERVAQACADARTRHWLPGLPSPYTVADAEAFIASRAEEAAAGAAASWCVAGTDDRCLASVSVEVRDGGRGGELGWWAHPDARGRGHVTRAARVAAGHALTAAAHGGLGLHRLLVRVCEGNSASRAVALRLGAREAGRDREAELLRDGSRRDLLRFDLLRSELAAPGGH